jgi:hypothetical protein
MKSGPVRVIFFICLSIFVGGGICGADNGLGANGLSTGTGIITDNISGMDNELKAEQMPAHEDQAHEDLFEGFVYYADSRKTGLKSVKMRFPSALAPHELGREIISALISGPSSSALEPVWPADTRLNALFITDDGNAYVDLNLPGEMGENMDTRSELLAVYSLVNSLTLNIPKIKQVKLLIQGEDAESLAGHIDLEYFYQTNMLIVK